MPLYNIPIKYIILIKTKTRNQSRKIKKKNCIFYINVLYPKFKQIDIIQFYVFFFNYLNQHIQVNHHILFMFK